MLAENAKGSKVPDEEMPLAQTGCRYHQSGTPLPADRPNTQRNPQKRPLAVHACVEHLWSSRLLSPSLSRIHSGNKTVPASTSTPPIHCECRNTLDVVKLALLGANRLQTVERDAPPRY